MTRRVAIAGRPFEITCDDGGGIDRGGEDFEPSLVRLLERLVRPDDFVVDVGARIGMTSILLGMLAREVVSYEGSPSTFQLLRMNVLRSGLGNVTTENVGLGSGHATVERTASLGAEMVQVTPLDHELLRRGLAGRKVDVIRLEAEGLEMEVLKGAGDCLARHKPVVALALNHWCLNAFRRIAIPDFFDFLRATFPFVYAVDADDSVRNLRDEGQAREVMHEHVARFRYANVVAGFSPSLPSLLLD